MRLKFRYGIFIFLLGFLTKGNAMEPGHPRPEFLTLLTANVFLHEATVDNGKVISANFIFLTAKDRARCDGKLGTECFDLVTAGLTFAEVSGSLVDLTIENTDYARKNHDLQNPKRIEFGKPTTDKSFAIALWTPFSFGWNNVAASAEFNRQVESLNDTKGLLSEIEKRLKRAGHTFIDKIEKKADGELSSYGELSAQKLSLKVSTQNEFNVDLVQLWWARGMYGEGHHRYQVTSQAISMHRDPPR